MKRAILLALLLAACTQPILTSTPPAPSTQTATAVTLETVAPTAVPEPATPAYPIILTVVPRALSSIDVHEAICKAVYTTYALYPYGLIISTDEDKFNECFGQ